MLIHPTVLRYSIMESKFNTASLATAGVQPLTTNNLSTLNKNNKVKCVWYK